MSMAHCTMQAGSNLSLISYLYLQFFSKLNLGVGDKNCTGHQNRVTAGYKNCTRAVRYRGQKLCSAPFAFLCRAQFLYPVVSADLLHIQDAGSISMLRDSHPDLQGTNGPLTGKTIFFCNREMIHSKCSKNDWPHFS